MKLSTENKSNAWIGEFSARSNKICIMYCAVGKSKTWGFALLINSFLFWCRILFLRLLIWAVIEDCSSGLNSKLWSSTFSIVLSSRGCFAIPRSKWVWYVCSSSRDILDIFWISVWGASLAPELIWRFRFKRSDWVKTYW